MIDLYKVDSIVDVIHGSVPISGLERAIISSPLYNRMHRILQNSMVYLTFPCNKTKRFEHGVGTMYLAGEMFFNSISNADEEILTAFFDEISLAINDWYSGINISTYSFINEEALNIDDENSLIRNYSSITDSRVALYKKYHPGNVKDENFFSYIIIFEAVRIAGLLHDVGHLPYSHIMEFALKSLYDELKFSEDIDSFNKERYNKFMTTLSPYYSKSSNCELHEAIGKKVVSILKDSIFSSLSYSSRNVEENVYNDKELLIVALSLDFAIRILDSEESDNNIFSDLHRIISGTIDADRLDYCSRDFFSVGLAKGAFDYRKLFNTYEMNRSQALTHSDREYNFVFCPSTKSLSMVEDLLYRRWRIYLDINYHHRVQRIHELMIHSVKQIAIRYLKNCDPQEETNSNSISLGIQGIWDMLDLMVNQRSPKAMEMKLIQLDDSWFDTMVKRQFSIAFRNPLSIQNNKNPLWCQLHEFVSSEKHYYSLIKQTDDFYEFDRMLYEFLSNTDFKIIRDLINELNSTSYSDEASIEKRPASLEQLIKTLTKANLNYDQFMVDSHGFIFRTLKEILAFLNKDGKLFDFMREEIPQSIKNNCSGLVDVIISTFKLKSGYDPSDPVFLAKHIKDDNEVKKSVQELETMSAICSLIKAEQAVFPGFYLYVCPIKGSAIQRSSILKQCAKQVSDFFCSCIEEYLLETKKMVF